MLATETARSFSDPANTRSATACAGWSPQSRFSSRPTRERRSSVSAGMSDVSPLTSVYGMPGSGLLNRSRRTVDSAFSWSSVTLAERAALTSPLRTPAGHAIEASPFSPRASAVVAQSATFGHCDPAFGVPSITSRRTCRLPPSRSMNHRETSPPIEWAITSTSLPCPAPRPTASRRFLNDRAVSGIGSFRLS